MTSPMQLDLFSEVIHSYSADCEGVLRNDELYRRVANRMALPEGALQERTPIGAAQQLHNVITRKIRWYQQTLKQAGILERVDGERGVWRLTQPASSELNRINPGVSVIGFSTDLGVAILGSCESVFSAIDAPITLCLTSPPYCLSKARKYGNPPESEYVDFVCRSLEGIVRNLVDGGSIALNVSQDIYISGSPARSMYVERLLLALHDRLSLSLMDRLVWHNPSRPPGPVQWASINRVQLNQSWEPVFWLTNNPLKVRSNNRRVLQEHTDRHLKLIKQGGEQRDGVFSDGAYRLKPGRFGNPTAGRIPRNVLSYSHTCSSQKEYKRQARAQGLVAHGAPMPLNLASFLVDFLSEPDDVVIDPFAGSFSTAVAAERLGRRWIGVDVMLEYVAGAANRFRDAAGFKMGLAV